MSKLVSVIIPCYNGEDFIDDSIRSVWEQEYPYVELVVVNDGSKDNTEKKIMAWQQRFIDKNWKLIYLFQENQGPGSATNLALKHVTGEYLTLLDADDVFLPGSISKRVSFLESNPDYDGVRSNGFVVKGANRWLFITEEKEKRLTDLFSAFCDGKTNNWAGSYMVRTSVLFSAYPDRNIDPSRFGQNFQILLPVCYKRKFGFIDEPLMEYRVQPDSHSQASDPLVSYQKNMVNTCGWRDIFHGIVQWLVQDDVERDAYIRRYDALFHRGAMNRAIAAGIKKDAGESYALLKRTGHLTLGDRMLYWEMVYPFFASPLRFLRRVYNKFKRMMYSAV